MTYTEQTIVKALQMYKEKKSFKEIINKLNLPKGDVGNSLINSWRRRAEIKPNRNPVKKWSKIKDELK